MKKLILSVSILALAGCTSYKDNISYTTNEPIVNIESVIRPTVTVGDKVMGQAVCSNMLFIFHDTPSKQTYGATINPKSGPVANTECAAAAVYDALSQSNAADILIAPKFTTITESFLCIPLVGCFSKTQTVLVEAHEGKVTYKNN